MLYGKLLKSQNNLIYKILAKNDIEIYVICDLPFSFLMRTVSGRAMLPDSTVCLLLLLLFYVYACVTGDFFFAQSLFMKKNFFKHLKLTLITMRQYSD